MCSPSPPSLLYTPWAASAGGWATVGLSSLPPAGLPANQDWPVDITVLQHGQTPLAGVTPVVRIRDDGGTVVKSFTATPTGKTGVYHAVVRFPDEGSYSYEVYDGFSSTAAPRRTRSSRSWSVPARASRTGWWRSPSVSLRRSPQRRSWRCIAAVPIQSRSN